MPDERLSGRRGPHPAGPVRRRAGLRAPRRPGRPGGRRGRHAAAGIPAEAVDEVILGAANQAGEDNRNVARMAVLLAGLAGHRARLHRQPAVRLRPDRGRLGRAGDPVAARPTWSSRAAWSR